MAQFYNYETELQVASGQKIGATASSECTSGAETIEPIAMQRCLESISRITDTYGSGLLNEQGYDLPRLRIAELAIGRHEVEGVHPKTLPYVHFEMPIGEFADRAEWNAVAVFNYGEAKLTNCITWYKDGTIKATWYGLDADSEYLSREAAEDLASDLESLANETDESYRTVLALKET